MSTTSKKRTHRQEKLARIYDDEILPVWSKRFGRMLLRDLELGERRQILDVGCGTGYPAVEIVRRLTGNSRLIAIDASSAMLDVARKKMAEAGARGVFFRTESASPRLSFADDVYDLVVCNLGLTEMASPARALADFARVTKPGGQVRCTLPLEGTFQEFYDIYREVLTKHDRHDTLQRLNDHLGATYPTVATCEQWMQAAGLEEVRVDVERFTMLFRSSREFFFAPVIEYGPLAKWKEIAGAGQEMQDVFWYIKEAIDAYFQDRAFAVTVVAGCLIGRKSADAIAEPPAPVVTEPTLSEIELGTDDIHISEVMERAGGGDREEEVDLDGQVEAEEDVQLDAFVEGKRRPGHLVEE